MSANFERCLPADRIDAIVIGASAGGVEALSMVLPALPANLRAPVFVVVHLPRERRSLLAEIFRTRCALAVTEAQDKEPVEPGHVYFAPPDYHMLLDREKPRAPRYGPEPPASSQVSISLSVDELVNYSRPAIDVLFESAADVYGSRLLGAILTGANNDGAAGLQAIRRAGGLALVQSPDSAQSSLMPESAIRKTPDALVCTLEQIAGILGSLDNRLAPDQP